MPLSFRSENYGDIAFGFFNIESDMLLLEKHFFFADMFCEWMSQLAKEIEVEKKKFQREVYYIEDPKDIGDLMGAIHGIRFSGFIGKVYTLFPFPKDANAFKQNPDGVKTQKTIRSQIESVSSKTRLSITFRIDGKVQIGPYRFDIKVFHELIQYVWQGGYPRWKDGIRPLYVIHMKEQIQKNSNRFFNGVFSS